MQVKKLLTLLLALALCMGAPALAEEDPIVVQAGDIIYRRSEVQQYWDRNAEALVQMGESFTEAEIEAFRQSVIDSYVSIAVMEQKYVQFGLDQLTPEDEARLEADAAAIYGQLEQSYIAGVMSRYGKTEEEARSYAPVLMELEGYTMESARRQALSLLKDERLLEHVSGDITQVDEDYLSAFYAENHVQPCRERYENDISAFEQEVLFYGAESYYIPAGYRYVQHILLSMPEESQNSLENLAVELVSAQENIEKIQNRIYAHELLEEDSSEAKQELADAQDALDQLNSAAQGILAGVAEHYADEIGEIMNALAAGTDYDVLLERYSMDDTMPGEGYMVHPDSVLYEAGFKDAVFALEAPGDVSDPVITSLGVHIFRYVGDAPEGALPLEGALREEMEEAALLKKKYERLEGFLKNWKNEFTIYTNAELLEVPACLIGQ